MKFRHISASTSKHGGVLGQRSEREATGKSINLYHFCCHCLKKTALPRYCAFNKSVNLEQNDVSGVVCGRLYLWRVSL